MIIDIEKTIREYLPNVMHLSLATVRDNKPWVCEVHYVFDNELNLYFRSKTARRHSQEIADNHFVAGNIVKQHILPEKPRGVYFEGVVQLLENVTKLDDAYKLYCDRFGTGPDILEEAKLDDGHKFYKITVNNYCLFDSLESSPSQKYELIWKK
ncbi:pyridoxamine 5'-phosphate oxidase family protein [Candidatus Woesebacteria bacterium]|nr:pyridoxamine 5'-phosphate oxidase family protein [Candidatus Woesebacteria bacterium]